MHKAVVRSCKDDTPLTERPASAFIFDRKLKAVQGLPLPGIHITALTGETDARVGRPKLAFQIINDILRRLGEVRCATRELDVLNIDGGKISRRPLPPTDDDERPLALHELQRRGTAMAGRLHSLHGAITSAAEEMAEEDVAADLRRDFDAFQEAWESLRVKFGVPIAQGGGRGGRGGGGGGRGGGAAAASVLASVAQLKGEILSFSEPPSEALVARYWRVRPEMESALSEATAMLERARALSQRLSSAGVSMQVPG